MRRPSSHMFEMGPEYEIIRGGAVVGTQHGLPSKDDSHITLPHDTDLKPGDVLVGKVSREEFVVRRIKPNVSGTTVLYLDAHNRLESRDDHSRTHITQNIGTVHGGVAGRDFHGDVLVNVNIGDVLNYLWSEIEKNADPEEKKPLLDKLGELSKHPIVVNLASLGVGQVVKWITGAPTQ